MERLTKKEFWDQVHAPSSVPSGRLGREGFVRRVLSVGFLKYFDSYSNHVLWELLLKRFIEHSGEKSVVEIGSAPGRFLLRFHDVFGHDPFGIEYSESGAAVNRALFQAWNIDPANVIQGDFFDDKTAGSYREKFDVVVSRGFVEHFTDVGPVLRRHCDLLKKGGALIVSVPNFRGANYWLMRFFNKEALAGHNLEIMGANEFRRLFESLPVSPVFCGYYGVFDFCLFNTTGNPVKIVLLLSAKVVQLFLNSILRIFSGQKLLALPWMSPYLIYIGVKDR